MTGALLALATAAAVTAGAMPLVLRVLRRRGLVDVPGPRSSHAVPTPRGGGIGPVLGLLLATGVASWAVGAAAVAVAGLLVAVLCFAAVGLAEDLHGVPAGPRLLLQVGAAAVAVPLLLRGAGPAGAAAVLVAVVAAVWLVSFANAFNFMDGVDGISVAQAAAGGTALGLVGLAAGVPALAVGGFGTAGAAVGFAPWNAHRARVFLGDVGSYGLGAALAALVVLGTAAGAPPLALVAPLLPYLADTSVTLLRRARAGEPLLTPHRSHAYQRLVDRGWSHQRVSGLVAALVVLCAALGAAGAAAAPAGRAVSVALLAATLAGYVALPSCLARLDASSTRTA